MRDIIRGLDGTIEYTIDTDWNGDKIVRNQHGEMLGRVINGQTRDKHGNLVSLNENIAALFGR